MAYATVQDLVDRFGEAELVRYTTPEGQPAEEIDVVRVQRALDDASDTIDSYLRRRYAVPVANPGPSLGRACCLLARCDLAQTSRSMPTEDMRHDRDGQIAWLKQLSSGVATLDGAVAASTPGEFARTSDRTPMLRRSNW